MKTNIIVFFFLSYFILVSCITCSVSTTNNDENILVVLNETGSIVSDKSLCTIMKGNLTLSDTEPYFSNFNNLHTVEGSLIVNFRYFDYLNLNYPFDKLVSINHNLENVTFLGGQLIVYGDREYSNWDACSLKILNNLVELSNSTQRSSIKDLDNYDSNSCFENNDQLLWYEVYSHFGDYKHCKTNEKTGCTITSANLDPTLGGKFQFNLLLLNFIYKDLPEGYKECTRVEFLCKEEEYCLTYTCFSGPIDPKISYIVGYCLLFVGAILFVVGIIVTIARLKGSKENVEKSNKKFLIPLVIANVGCFFIGAAGILIAVYTPNDEYVYETRDLVLMVTFIVTLIIVIICNVRAFLKD